MQLWNVLKIYNGLAIAYFFIDKIKKIEKMIKESYINDQCPILEPRL